jgi:hypothetical protein
VEDLTELAAEYDPVVVSTGAGGLGQLFARDEQSSPFNKPQRHLCAGLFKGIAEQETKAVTFGISPGAGELIEIPTVTFGGDATALLFENHPGYRPTHSPPTSTTNSARLEYVHSASKTRETVYTPMLSEHCRCGTSTNG